MRHHAGRARLPLVGLRLVWEFGLPLALLGGVRLLLGGNLGAQSWAEILAAFPDFTLWLWGCSLLVLLTGAIRLALARRALRSGPAARQPVAGNSARGHRHSARRGATLASDKDVVVADDVGSPR